VYSPLHVLDEVDHDEDEHGGVDEQHDEDGKVEPDELVHVTIEVTAPARHSKCINVLNDTIHTSPQTWA
jgi:hypothetical protein